MDQKIPEPLSKPVEPTKPTVNVPPEQAHAAMATSTPLGTPAANVGKSGRGKSMLVGFLTLLLVIGCASLGYLLWRAKQDIDILNADHKSAMEQWDKKRAETEARIKELEGKQGVESGASDKTDESLITEAAQNFVDAMVDSEKIKLAKPVIFESDKNFAKVSATDEVGGSVIILKKANNNWVVVTSGQAVDEQAYNMFGIPEE